MSTRHDCVLEKGDTKGREIRVLFTESNPLGEKGSVHTTVVCDRTGQGNR